MIVWCFAGPCKLFHVEQWEHLQYGIADRIRSGPVERGQQEPECSRLGEHFLPQIKQPAGEGESFFPAGRLAEGVCLGKYNVQNVSCLGGGLTVEQCL